ncbi:MAG: 3-methyl-2-oxobutanoate hydroxymethyltransferase [Gammaproteobacteria bacterium]|nr:3-methyl-2-oxobutanoate hydroxymethyltransferase [Gammaproteobacteria bacterium]|tara:strand:- start:31279 stop:32052 length:774 start_codon:yes stop_codon:yes gene_type:complete
MPRKSLKNIQQMKAKNIGISCLTAYDASFASILDKLGIDIILVGDSLGEVVKGDKSTHNVIQDEMIYHTKSVKKGIKNAYLISDMVIDTYKTKKEALHHALQLINCGANMIKIESTLDHLSIIKFLVSKNIKVCGHIGIRPQYKKKNTPYKKVGITNESKILIMNEALAIEKSGASLLITECIGSDLAKTISQKLSIPVIGIGSGNNCDGQILVLYDLLGISYNGVPKFINNDIFKNSDIKTKIKKYINKTKNKHKF